MANPDNFFLAELTSTLSSEEDSGAIKHRSGSSLYATATVRQIYCQRHHVGRCVIVEHMIMMPTAGEENGAMTQAMSTCTTIQAQANTWDGRIIFNLLCPGFFVTAFYQLQRGQSSFSHQM